MFTFALSQKLQHVTISRRRFENMIGLAEKTLAELESLAQDLRAMISRDPQLSQAELGDVEWEMEKRHWRKDARPDADKQVVKDGPPL
jgi:chaperonin cofactor prefoldin